MAATKLSNFGFIKKASAIAALVLAALVFGVSASCETGADLNAQSGKETVLKVMTINLRHHADMWQERFPLIADEIARLDPDVIGLQEVAIGIDQSSTLLGLIKEKSGGDAGTSYYRFDRLKSGMEAISGEGVSIYSKFPFEEKNFADLKNGRVVQFARIEIADGLAVDMYNTHLHHIGGDETRLPQAKRIVSMAAKFSPAHLAFLTGDMNAKPDSATIAAFESFGFVDTYALVHGEATELTGNTSSIKLEKGRDGADQHPRSRIDYVFMRTAPDGPRVDVADSVVCFRNFNEEGLYPSDHLGVMTTFRIYH